MREGKGKFIQVKNFLPPKRRNEHIVTKEVEMKGVFKGETTQWKQNQENKKVEERKGGEGRESSEGG